jgi:hypothetical protein
MDGTFKFLVWAVMVTLILAIARQLSEQTCHPLFPMKLGFSDYMDAQDVGVSSLTAQNDPAKWGTRLGSYEQKTNNHKP